MIHLVRATEQCEAHRVNLCNPFDSGLLGAPNCGLKKYCRLQSRTKSLGKGQLRG